MRSTEDMFGSARGSGPNYEHNDYSTRSGVVDISLESTSDTRSVLELGSPGIYLRY